MLAYFVLLLAVLSRILPHAFHAVSWTSPLSAEACSSSAPGMGSSKRAAWMLPCALVVLMATDYYPHRLRLRLSLPDQDLPCHLAVVRRRLPARNGHPAKPTVLRVAASVLATSTSFFLISNFVVWFSGSMSMYPRSLAGLEPATSPAIPFYRTTWSPPCSPVGALFGLPVLAAHIIESLHAARHTNLPLA